jgi:Flp pilus assembly protein TadD
MTNIAFRGAASRGEPRPSPSRLRFAALILAGSALAACQDAPQKNISEAVDQTLRQGGAMAAASGGWQEAAATYRSLYERNPGDTGAALGWLHSLRNNGQADEAMRVGAAATARHPDDAALLGEYGKARLAARDLAGALETLAAAASRAPRDWTLQSAIGIARDLRGEHREAQEAYRAALELVPNNPTVLNNLALSLALSGDLEGGIASLEGASFRGSPQTRQSLALLYALKGDTARAAPLLRRDLPERQASENLAYLRQLDEARPRSETSVAAEPVEPLVAPEPPPARRAALPRRTPVTAVALEPPVTTVDDVAEPASPAPAPVRKARRKPAPALAVAPEPAPPVEGPAEASPAASASLLAAPVSNASPPAAKPSGGTRHLLRRGDELLRLNDVTAARLFYERAAASGDPAAAFALGRTYDATFLADIKAPGSLADAAKAAEWYRAAGSGGGEAPSRPTAGDDTVVAARSASE